MVIDGSKALRRALLDVFEQPLIQRCQLHKVRNVKDKLPERLRSTVERRMRQAYRVDSALDAEAQLLALARELDKTHPGAAASLREGLAETLTVLRLDVPPTLARTLRSTEASFPNITDVPQSKYPAGTPRQMVGGGSLSVALAFRPHPADTPLARKLRKKAHVQGRGDTRESGDGALEVITAITEMGGQPAVARGLACVVGGEDGGLQIVLRQLGRMRRGAGAVELVQGLGDRGVQSDTPPGHEFR